MTSLDAWSLGLLIYGALLWVGYQIATEIRELRLATEARLK